MPQPSDNSFVGDGGVVPGDVGTYTAGDGFKKFFNLWDDKTSIEAASRLFNEAEYQPPLWNVTRGATMNEGETVVEGVASSVTGPPDRYRRSYTWSVLCVRFNDHSSSHVSAFEFSCQSPQGAMLALTSSADLEETADVNALRQCIVRHARLFYKHANNIRGIGPEESLYIITGCIKSDSWAIAAYRRPMTHPHDTLRLVRIFDNTSTTNCEAKYRWTSRGTSEARTWDRGSKRHSLFLRGYKLSFSPAARVEMNRSTRPSRTTPDSDDKGLGGNHPSTSGDRNDERGHDSEHGVPEGSGSGVSGSDGRPPGGKSSTSQAHNLEEMCLDIFPMDRSEVGVQPH